MCKTEDSLFFRFRLTMQSGRKTYAVVEILTPFPGKSKFRRITSRRARLKLVMVRSSAARKVTDRLVPLVVRVIQGPR